MHLIGLLKKCLGNLSLVEKRHFERHFEEANKCHICNGLNTEKDIKVRYHSYTRSECGRSAHQNCNAKFQLKNNTC